MNDMEKSIQNLLTTYKKAVEAKDVKQFVSIYHQDVVIFDMWGNWVYQGLEAWEKVVQDWFDSLGNDQATVEITDVQLIPDQNIACLFAIFTFQGLSGSGETTHAMDNRFTWVLKNQRGGWLIMHEHSSAPIDFVSNKVILNRSSNQKN